MTGERSVAEPRPVSGGRAHPHAETAARYREAALRGDCEAQDNLGIAYYTGEGVPKNVVEAVKWWRKSAEQGYDNAQYNLGLMYVRGEIVKNNAEGLKWLRLAADQGHQDAKALYTEMVDEAKSVHLWGAGPDDVLRSWAILNVWLSQQTDEKVVKKMLEKELALGRKVRPTIALRIYMKFSSLRRQREMKELYSR